MFPVIRVFWHLTHYLMVLEWMDGYQVDCPDPTPQKPPDAKPVMCTVIRSQRTPEIGFGMYLTWFNQTLARRNGHLLIKLWMV